MDDGRRVRRGLGAVLTLVMLLSAVAASGAEAGGSGGADGGKHAGRADHAGSGGHKGHDKRGGPRTVRTATYNLYLGADLLPIFAAGSEAELVQRAGEAYAAMEATDFHERAGAIAGLLSERRPEVVGLQEVARWERGPLDGELAVTHDFLDILLDELAARGTPYRAVAVNENFSGQLPVSATEQARFSDRDVIIVRDGLPASRLRTAHPQSGTFAAELVVPTPVPGLSFEVPRGWSTVDVKVRGRTFRFANTHLEAFGPAEIRNAQARELVDTLAGSPHPVVLAGDLNSRPTDAAGAYGTVTGAGYADAWTAAGGDPAGGWTSGQTASLLDPGTLASRIDYVLFQPRGVRAVAAEVIGDEEADRTSPTGFWPSDHAGVVTRLVLGRR